MRITLDENAIMPGRSFIGMELDPGYFETAQKRIEDARIMFEDGKNESRR